MKAMELAFCDSLCNEESQPAHIKHETSLHARFYSENITYAYIFGTSLCSVMYFNFSVFPFSWHA